MQIINGSILEKNTECDKVEKTIVTLGLEKGEKCFVQVRSKYLRNIVDKLSIGDNVQMVISFEGKQANSGNRFNNLIASIIKKID